MSGDTVNIWQDRTFYWLTSSPLTNKVVFDLKADTSFRQRDALELAADFHFLSKGGSVVPGKAIMGITYTFANDSVQGTTRLALSSGSQRLYLKPDSAYDIRNVSGFIYYRAAKGERSDLLINNIRLTRYHAKELAPIPVDTLKPETPKP